MPDPYLQTFGPGATASPSSVNAATRGGISTSDLPAIARGQMVTASLVAATPQTVSHTLRRAPIGGLVAALSSAGSPNAIKVGGFTAQALTLESDVDCDVSVWVF